MSEVIKKSQPKNIWLRFINEANKHIWIKCIIIISIILSLYNVFVKQPMTYNDEENHFTRSIEIANGDIKVSENGDMSQIGGYISTSENEFNNVTVFRWATNSNHVNVFWIKEYAGFEYSDEKIFRATTNTIPNNPIVYLPYTIAALFAKWFCIRPVYEFLIMRLFGLAFFNSIYVLAICLSNKGKIPLAIMSLCPTVFCTFSSITADAYLFAISALALTTLFELYDRVTKGERLSGKFLVLVCISSILVVCAKLPSFLFIVLFLPIIYSMIKSKCYDSKTILLMVVLIVITAIISIAWFLYVKDANTGAFFKNNSDTNAQIEFILNNKLTFLGVMVKELVGFGYWQLAFGYVNNNYPIVPDPISILFFIGLYMSTRYGDFSDGNKQERVGIKHSRNDCVIKLFAILISIVYVLLVFVMVYLQFCDVGAESIPAQSRYFIPVYMLLMLMISYVYDKRKENKYIITALASLPAISYLVFSIIGLNL